MENTPDNNTSIYIAVILPAVLAVFVIFFLVMPKVRENRQEPAEITPSGGTSAEEASVESFEECEAAGFPVMESYPRQCATEDGRNFIEEIDHAGGEEQMLGGDRDDHGCIGSAGYTWCEAKEKCLRVWEEGCEEAAQ